MILAVCIIISNKMYGQTTRVFYDDFNGTTMNSGWWHIPTWVSPTDGTFLGRTQFRCSQNASLPSVSNSQAIINLETYNPTGFSFYGTDLISNRSFMCGSGLIFTIRAKIQAPTSGGIVGGIFLYDLTTGNLHDEIDFELLTNQNTMAHNNVYDNEPLGAGHPDSSYMATPITDYHMFVIRWLPNMVEWSVDGSIVRIETNLVPTGPMHLHLNMWAPAAEWPSAYNATLQPTNTISTNQIYSMIVDSVRVDSLGISTTDISEMNTTPDLQFYPNPAHDIIHFTTLENIVVSIYSMNGSLVKETAISNGNISVNDVLPGIYAIKYIYQNKQTTKKLVIR